MSMSGLLGSLGSLRLFGSSGSSRWNGQCPSLSWISLGKQGSGITS